MLVSRLVEFGNHSLTSKFQPLFYSIMWENEVHIEKIIKLKFKLYIHLTNKTKVDKVDFL